MRRGQGGARPGQGKDNRQVKPSQRQLTRAAKVEFESGFVGFLEAGEVRANEDQTRYAGR